MINLYILLIVEGEVKVSNKIVMAGDSAMVEDIDMRKTLLMLQCCFLWGHIGNCQSHALYIVTGFKKYFKFLNFFPNNSKYKEYSPLMGVLNTLYLILFLKLFNASFNYFFTIAFFEFFCLQLMYCWLHYFLKWSKKK